MTPDIAFERLIARAAVEMAPALHASPAMEGALALARDIAAAHGEAVQAILFYGSCRRSGEAEGLLDLYVLHDGPRRFHGPGFRAASEALLPPTVLHQRGETSATGPLRAKVAVMSRRQFEQRVRQASLDTTIWARFCQPVSLVYARDDAAAAWAHRVCARAFATAALWAARLGPARGGAGLFWKELFARTYGAELRAEGSLRGVSIHDAAADWFDGGLPLALTANGLCGTPDDRGDLSPGLPSGRRWEGGWAWRRRLGKVLNIARLVKAAFTFEGGADYLRWKIERHSGQPLPLTPWQRRHPVMASPLLLWHLWRRGMVR